MYLAANKFNYKTGAFKLRSFLFPFIGYIFLFLFLYLGVNFNRDKKRPAHYPLLFSYRTFKNLIINSITSSYDRCNLEHLVKNQWRPTGTRNEKADDGSSFDSILPWHVNYWNRTRDDYVYTTPMIIIIACCGDRGNTKSIGAKCSISQIPRCYTARRRDRYLSTVFRGARLIDLINDSPCQRPQAIISRLVRLF